MKRYTASTPLAHPHPTAPRGNIQVKASVQWMTVTSLVPCNALHVPQRVAVSLSEPLTQISSAPYTKTVFACLYWSFVSH